MVQILVQIRVPTAAQAHFELLECEPETTVLSIKHQIAEAGKASGNFSLQPQDQELVFMGERCRDDGALRDYGVCEPWIVQVTGFTINPGEPGKMFVDGKLVPCQAQ